MARTTHPIRNFAKRHSRLARFFITRGKDIILLADPAAADESVLALPADHQEKIRANAQSILEAVRNRQLATFGCPEPDSMVNASVSEKLRGVYTVRDRITGHPTLVTRFRIRWQWWRPFRILVIVFLISAIPEKSPTDISTL
jgi:hypothetical protein